MRLQNGLRNPEVGYFHHAIARQENVRWLYIAMDDSGRFLKEDHPAAELERDTGSVKGGGGGGGGVEPDRTTWDDAAKKPKPAPRT